MLLFQYLQNVKTAIEIPQVYSTPILCNGGSMVECTASNPILKMLMKLPHHPVASASAKNDDEEDNQVCTAVDVAAVSAMLGKKSGDADNCVEDTLLMVGEDRITRGVTQAFAFQTHNRERLIRRRVLILIFVTCCVRCVSQYYNVERDLLLIKELYDQEKVQSDNCNKSKVAAKVRLSIS